MINSQENILNSINDLIDETIKKYDFNKINIQFLKKNIKEKNVYGIYLFEPDYPKLYNSDNSLKGVYFPVLSFKLEKQGKYKNMIQVRIKNDFLYNSIDIPKTVISITKNGNDGKALRFNFDDENLIKYIKKHIDFTILNYRSSTSTFGCCSKFNECSDAKKCIHENKLYASRCMYKLSLDMGKIYYGKNKNNKM